VKQVSESYKSHSDL